MFEMKDLPPTLPIKIGERQFNLDTGDLLAQVQKHAEGFLNDKVGKLERQAVKAAINTLFLMKGIPRDENRDLLDYTSELILRLLIGLWAENGIECKGEEIHAS